MGRRSTRNSFMIAVGLLCLFAFQNCKFETNGNGGGYTGLQDDESLYGAFEPGRTVVLPPIGVPMPGTVILRSYYLFEKSRACGGATSAQTLATEMLSFIDDRTIWRQLDCGIEVGTHELASPQIASYNPWFILESGKIFQLLNEAIAVDKTPYTLGLCRQITGSSGDVDYGWDVILQDRGGLLEATIIRGRQDPVTQANLRKIWGPISIGYNSGASPLEFSGNSFSLKVTVPSPVNHTETTGSLQAVLDGNSVQLNLACWLQNQ
ncbi:MAG: hypothetical protein IT288_02290 [Bdellovibrionales bacterium]|nr:hypothetical protein [Bdellovibrionales bacterium]